jgi:ribonuclease HI
MNKFPRVTFMGPSQSTQSGGGAWGIIFLSPNHTISFKARIRVATNNFIELLVLKLVLIIALEKGLTQIRIMGDSLLVI